MRESISEAFQKLQNTKKYDISLPLPKFYDLVLDLRQKYNGLIVGFGHVGDGNLHLNISGIMKDDIDDYIYTWVSSNNGSISAEHGIGQMKRPYLHFSKCKDAIDIMKHIKYIFDPNNILNPGKIF